MTSSTSRRPKRPGEFALIAELFAPLARAPGALGLTDDAALLKPPKGRDHVVTTDAVVEGVHFLKSDPADSIARKALRVNLSDLAAKGAEPVGYLLALSLPDRIDHRWLKSFARGLARDQKTFGISLLGGDTTRTPGPLSIAITAIGSVPKGRMIKRRGARPGDLVFVSGTIGDAGAGLECLTRRRVSGKSARHLIGRYRLPEPRLALGKKLAGVASAAIDVSDGLVADLGHIAETSKVRIVVDPLVIPLSGALRALRGDNDQAVIRAATSGDDYELAFTCRRADANKVLAIARAAGVPVTECGFVTRGKGVVLIDNRRKPRTLSRGGYTHF
jgi:thiamine-monophosphate kinase